MNFKIMDKSLATMGFAVIISSVLILMLSQSPVVNARYLPTRSNGDRLERLEELLQNLYESNNMDPRGAPLGYPMGMAPVPAAYKFKRASPYSRGHVVRSSERDAGLDE